MGLSLGFIKVDRAAKLGVKVALEVPHGCFHLLKLLLLVVQLGLLLLLELLDVVSRSFVIYRHCGLSKEQHKGAFFAEGLFDGANSVNQVIKLFLQLLDILFQVSILHIKLAELANLLLVSSLDLCVLLAKLGASWAHSSDLSHFFSSEFFSRNFL